jgi:anaerobic selenocysteine-containing dehydrogenase
MDRLADEFAAAIGAERVRWEPFAYEPLRAASRMVYGIDAVPVHDFSNAEVVITFGADFLETWLSPDRLCPRLRAGPRLLAGPARQAHLRDAAPVAHRPERRRVGPARPGTEHLVALAIARLIVDNGAPRPARPRGLLAGVDVANAAQRAGVSPERLRQIAA